MSSYGNARYKLALFKLLNGVVFELCLSLCTIYSLFADDIRIYYQLHSADHVFFVLAVIILVIFALELIVRCIVYPKYWPVGYYFVTSRSEKRDWWKLLGTSFFWLDVISIVGLGLDIHSVLVDLEIHGSSDLLVATRENSFVIAVIRAGRASRMGTRAVRLIRLCASLTVSVGCRRISRPQRNASLSHPREDTIEVLSDTATAQSVAYPPSAYSPFQMVTVKKHNMALSDSQKARDLSENIRNKGHDENDRSRFARCCSWMSISQFFCCSMYCRIRKKDSGANGQKHTGNLSVGERLIEMAAAQLIGGVLFLLFTLSLANQHVFDSSTYFASFRLHHLAIGNLIDPTTIEPLFHHSIDAITKSSDISLNLRSIRINGDFFDFSGSSATEIPRKSDKIQYEFHTYVPDTVFGSGIPPTYLEAQSFPTAPIYDDMSSFELVHSLVTWDLSYQRGLSSLRSMYLTLLVLGVLGGGAVAFAVNANSAVLRPFRAMYSMAQRINRAPLAHASDIIASYQSAHDNTGKYILETLLENDPISTSRDKVGQRYNSLIHPGTSLELRIFMYALLSTRQTFFSTFGPTGAAILHSSLSSHGKLDLSTPGSMGVGVFVAINLRPLMEWCDLFPGKANNASITGGWATAGCSICPEGNSSNINGSSPRRTTPITAASGRPASYSHKNTTRARQSKKRTCKSCRFAYQSPWEKLGEEGPSYFQAMLHLIHRTAAELGGVPIHTEADAGTLILGWYPDALKDDPPPLLSYILKRGPRGSPKYDLSNAANSNSSGNDNTGNGAQTSGFFQSGPRIDSFSAAPKKDNPSPTLSQVMELATCASNILLQQLDLATYAILGYPSSIPMPAEVFDTVHDLISTSYATEGEHIHTNSTVQHQYASNSHLSAKNNSEFLSESTAYMDPHRDPPKASIQSPDRSLNTGESLHDLKMQQHPTRSPPSIPIKDAFWQFGDLYFDFQSQTVSGLQPFLEGQSTSTFPSLESEAPAVPPGFPSHLEREAPYASFLLNSARKLERRLSNSHLFSPQHISTASPSTQNLGHPHRSNSDNLRRIGSMERTSKSKKPNRKMLRGHMHRNETLEHIDFFSTFPSIFPWSRSTNFVHQSHNAPFHVHIRHPGHHHPTKRVNFSVSSEYEATSKTGSASLSHGEDKRHLSRQDSGIAASVPFFPIGADAELVDLYAHHGHNAHRHASQPGSVASVPGASISGNASASAKKPHVSFATDSESPSPGQSNRFLTHRPSGRLPSPHVDHDKTSGSLSAVSPSHIATGFAPNTPVGEGIAHSSSPRFPHHSSDDSASSPRATSLNSPSSGSQTALPPLTIRRESSSVHTGPFVSLSHIITDYPDENTGVRTDGDTSPRRSVPILDDALSCTIPHFLGSLPPAILCPDARDAFIHHYLRSSHAPPSATPSMTSHPSSNTYPRTLLSCMCAFSTRSNSDCVHNFIPATMESGGTMSGMHGARPLSGSQLVSVAIHAGSGLVACFGGPSILVAGPLLGTTHIHYASKMAAYAPRGSLLFTQSALSFLPGHIRDAITGVTYSDLLESECRAFQDPLEAPLTTTTPSASDIPTPTPTTEGTATPSASALAVATSSTNHLLTSDFPLPSALAPAAPEPWAVFAPASAGWTDALFAGQMLPSAHVKHLPASAAAAANTRNIQKSLLFVTPRNTPETQFGVYQPKWTVTEYHLRRAGSVHPFHPQNSQYQQNLAALQAALCRYARELMASSDDSLHPGTYNVSMTGGTSSKFLGSHPHHASDKRWTSPTRTGRPILPLLFSKRSFTSTTSSPHTNHPPSPPRTPSRAPSRKSSLQELSVDAHGTSTPTTQGHGITSRIKQLLSPRSPKRTSQSSLTPKTPTSRRGSQGSNSSTPPVSPASHHPSVHSPMPSHSSSTPNGLLMQASLRIRPIPHTVELIGPEDDERNREGHCAGSNNCKIEEDISPIAGVNAHPGGSMFLLPSYQFSPEPTGVASQLHHPALRALSRDSGSRDEGETVTTKSSSDGADTSLHCSPSANVANQQPSAMHPGENQEEEENFAIGTHDAMTWESPPSSSTETRLLPIHFIHDSSSESQSEEIRHHVRPMSVPHVSNSSFSVDPTSIARAVALKDLEEIVGIRFDTSPEVVEDSVSTNPMSITIRPQTSLETGSSELNISTSSAPSIVIHVPDLSNGEAMPSTSTNITPSSLVASHKTEPTALSGASLALSSDGDASGQRHRNTSLRILYTSSASESAPPLDGESRDAVPNLPGSINSPASSMPSSPSVPMVSSLSRIASEDLPPRSADEEEQKASSNQFL